MSDPTVKEAFAAGRIPEGITSAYLNESRDKATIVAICLVCTLATLVLSARIFARFFILRRFGLDEGLALLSWGLFVAFAGLSIELIQLGSGRHYAYIQYVLDMQTVELTEIYDFIAHIIYTLSLLFCRLSGLAFYGTIANNHDSYLLGIRIVTVFIIVVSWTQLFLIIFHCLPITGLWPYDWQPHAEDFKCLQWGLVYSVNSAVSLVNDLILYGIPSIMIWRLKLQRKRKIQLACILLPGVLVIVISVARLALVAVGQWEPDMSWEYDPMLAVETSEIGFTIISLSIPGCKLIVDKIFTVRARRLNASSQYNDIEAGSDKSGKGNTTVVAVKNVSEVSSDGDQPWYTRRAGVWGGRGYSYAARASVDKTASTSTSEDIFVRTEVTVESVSRDTLP